MSKFKDPTGDTPPLSSAENIEAKAQPSGPSARPDSTPSSMQTSRKPSPDMLSSDKDGLTTPATTPPITEKTRQHAMLMRVTLRQLEKAGLIRRFKVLSAGATTPSKVRIEFDLSTWTEDLELK